ncbi:MAG: LysR family transcriptional regulator [Tagaea sp.]
MDDVSRLRTFLAVYRAGGATRAAAGLGLTQPAVTGHLQALARRLGRPLFRREGRGLTPTVAAHDLARAIGPSLDGLESAFSRIAARGGDLAGVVRIGGPAEFLGAVVLPALASARQDGVDLKCEFGVWSDIAPRLASSELDLALATKKPRQSGIDHATVYREHLSLVGAPVFAQGRAPADPRRLLDLPWIGYADAMPLARRYAREALGGAEPPAPRWVVPDLRALAIAAASGAGLAVLPEYICRDMVADGRLVRLHRPAKPPYNDIHLAWNRLGLRHPRNAWLRDRILAAAKLWR